ncbi:MAG: FRG domain-containing protein [Planctomycetota bacterium]
MRIARGIEDTTPLFRGESRDTYELKPKIGRVAYHASEAQVLSDFTRYAAAFGIDQSSLLERMAIAQHFGLATRLLDWTRNLLAAAFFATEEKRVGPEAVEPDGLIHVGLFDTMPRLSPQPATFDEFHAKETEIFVNRQEALTFFPHHSVDRIQRQAGCFTLFRNPTKPLVDGNGVQLARIRIPGDCKEQFRRDLFLCGTTQAVLFPDLQGCVAAIHYAFANKMQDPLVQRVHCGQPPRILPDLSAEDGARAQGLQS